MAKKRSSSRFRAVPFSIQLALGTLADETVVAGNLFASNSTRDSYIVSIDWSASMRNHTAAEGPVEIGFAHDDYTVGEIAECLDAGASFDPGNKVAQEQARRLVRTAGIFSGLTTDETLHLGTPKRTTMKFLVSQGFNVSFWARNRNGSALTTGSVIELSGKAYMRQS